MEFVVEDETDVLDNKAGTTDEAMDKRIDGVGCSVGKTPRGLPNVGSESERGVELGCKSVGNEAETGSVMVLDTSWFLESDYQHMISRRWNDLPIAVMTPSLLILAETNFLFSSSTVNLPSF